MLPREYPPWQTVYYHFRKWRLDGRLRQAHDRLRSAVRETDGREREPTAAVIDSQAVKGAGVGGPERQLWRYGLEEKPRGFRVLPRGWVVERTFAWLGQARRLAKDYERLPETAVAMIYAEMSRIMLRRLARMVR